MNLANQKSRLLFATVILFVALTGTSYAGATAGTELQITNDLNVQLWPAIYGDKIVWADQQMTDPFGTYLYLYTISTGEQRQLITSGSYKRNLQMHGDILTWSDASGGLYLYDIKKGEGKSFVSSSLQSAQGPVSIYDDKIVFAATGMEGGELDIFMYDTTTGTTTRITSDPTPERVPAIYRNKIVFFNDTPIYGQPDWQKRGVYVYDLETQQLIKISSGLTIHSGNPPEIYEHTVAWAETDAGGGAARYLHIYDLKTKTDTNVDTGSSIGAQLRIFRDKIVWVGVDLVSNKNAIYLYDITTGEQSHISSDTAELDPWSPPDIHEGGVVWSDYRSGTTYDIYLYQFTPQNRPPTLSFPEIGPYAGDGIDPNKGTADKDLFTFKAVYTDEKSPNEIVTHITQNINPALGFFRQPPYVSAADAAKIVVRDAADISGLTSKMVVGYKSAPLEFEEGIDEGESLEYSLQGNEKDEVSIWLLSRTMSVGLSHFVEVVIEGINTNGVVLTNETHLLELPIPFSEPSYRLDTFRIHSDADGIAKIRISVPKGRSNNADTWLYAITTTEILPMTPDTQASPASLKDSDYTNSEQYSVSSQFPKGEYDYYFTAIDSDGLSVRKPENGSLSFIAGFSNVLFLPGIMGSRLYEEGLNCGTDIVGPECGDQELWVSTSDPRQEKLSLDTQGKSINNLYTKDDTQNNGEKEKGIIDEIAGANIYKSFIADLKNWKRDGTIADYAFIPYDWRLSLDDIITNGTTNGNNNLSYTNSQGFSESFILKKLADLQENSKSGKVTIIAHSNGGLVAKALAQKLKDTNNPLYNKIDKIIFIATPQVGTPDAIATLLHGASLGHGLIMGADRSRQLSENMPSVYNLLPSAGYFTTVDPAFAIDKVASFENKPFFNPQTSQYGVYISNETELKNYILGTDGRSKPSFNDTVHPNIGNSSLYAQAEAVHQILDNWQPSPDTKVIQVAGWGEETLAGLDYKSYIDFWGLEYLSYKPNMVVDGDGTVVAPSALWMSTSNPNVERWWVDLKTYNKNNIPDRVHKNILEISNLRSFIKSKIEDSTFTDPDNIIINKTSTLISDDIRRLRYTLHSPLTLGIIDAQGRYTGQDPVTKEIKEEIPNVTYRQIGDVQFISVPTDIAYTLKMQGYQEGSFSLDVDTQEGNNITSSTSFQGIPSSASTIATIDIVSNQEIENSMLNIDQNGDGTVDKTLTATPDGITVYDIVPPELQITFDINNKNVVFSGQDDHDPNPTVTTANTSITLMDAQGNTTIIPFTKYKENKTRLRFSYNKIIRNGITTVVPNTDIVYDWQEKKGVLTDLDTKIKIKGVEKYVFNYKKSNNITIIKKKTSSGIVTTTRPGFVVVTIKTEDGSLIVNY